MSRNVIANCLRISSVLSLVVALSATFATPSFSETIVLRSGGGYAVLSPDLAWNYLAGPATLPLSASPFTPADFAAALSGPPAIVVPAYGGGGLWATSLACDPIAQWISVDGVSGPASALFARNFDVTTCCIEQAILTFCWTADDFLGDAAYGGANPSGVYLNQTPTVINGGNYATETSMSLDVTGFVHCGRNEIHVYDRDGAAVVSGVMFSATLDIIECPLKTESKTWGAIKALYR